MLRIIPEFYDIKRAVVALQQVCLRTAAHLPDQSDGVDGHAGFRLILSSRAIDWMGRNGPC
jgi:hypothetical protein